MWNGDSGNRQGVCPNGWHLPTSAEWDQLVWSVDSPAGTRLKSTIGWISNGNGTNDYGFSALPGGFRYTYGEFDNAGYCGNWWTATERSADYAYYRGMYYNYNVVNVNDYDSKRGGSSVRCIADE